MFIGKHKPFILNTNAQSMNWTVSFQQHPSSCCFVNMQISLFSRSVCSAVLSSNFFISVLTKKGFELVVRVFINICCSKKRWIFHHTYYAVQKKNKMLFYNICHDNQRNLCPILMSVNLDYVYLYARINQ